MTEPIELTNKDEIQAMLEKSRDQQVLLYKHSASCPISAYAWYEVKDCLDRGGQSPVCYRVTVQLHPEVSRGIAAALEVIHHTPQVIIVRDGKASYVASHWQIRKQTLQRALTS